MAQDAAEGIEPVEAHVPGEHHVGLRASFEERGCARWPRGQQVCEAAQPFGAARVAGGDALECLGAFGRGGAGAFREDDGDVVSVHAAAQRPQSVELGRGVCGVTIEEVVGEPEADHVEAGVGEQFALEHVSRVHADGGGDDPGADQGIGQAGMAAEQHHWARSERLGVAGLDADARGDAEPRHQTRCPPTLQRIVQTPVRAPPGCPEHRGSDDTGDLQPGPAEAEGDEACDREPETQPHRVDEQCERQPQRDQHHERDRCDQQPSDAHEPAPHRPHGTDITRSARPIVP